MEKLIEIKKGQEGRGMLLECEGFVNPCDKSNMELQESYKRTISESVRDGDEFYCPYPLIYNAVLQRYGSENANGRIYPENILKREVDKYQQAVKEKRAMGELNHPDDVVIDLDRVAINVVEMHWEGNTLVGKIEIITSEGFRKHGVISCKGDQVANLLLSGYKIGLSSRGLGSVTKKLGVMMVEDDFELVCFDVVSEPSTKNAWIVNNSDTIPDEYLKQEQIRPQNEDNLLSKLENFSKWLKN